MAILESQNVTKRFGGLTAVSQFDVQVEETSIHSIIGPNGAGKTTFFNCVTGFYRHEEGSILFEGEPVDGMSTDRITRLGIARTYQNIRLFQNMTVMENVLGPGRRRMASSQPRFPSRDDAAAVTVLPPDPPAAPGRHRGATRRRPGHRFRRSSRSGRGWR